MAVFPSSVFIRPAEIWSQHFYWYGTVTYFVACYKFSCVNMYIVHTDDAGCVSNLFQSQFSEGRMSTGSSVVHLW